MRSREGGQSPPFLGKLQVGGSYVASLCRAHGGVVQATEEAEQRRVLVFDCGQQAACLARVDDDSSVNGVGRLTVRGVAKPSEGVVGQQALFNGVLQRVVQGGAFASQCGGGRWFAVDLGAQGAEDSADCRGFGQDRDRWGRLANPCDRTVTFWTRAFSCRSGQREGRGESHPQLATFGPTWLVLNKGDGDTGQRLGYALAVSGGRLGPLLGRIVLGEVEPRERRRLDDQ